jgi:cytochrome P450
MVLPVLQKDLGPWSPGGRLRRAVGEFSELVLSRLQAPDGGLVQESREELGQRGAGRGFDTELLVQRTRTVLAGWQPTATTLGWLCFRTLGETGIRDRVVEAARSETPEGRRYLEAACLETLRLNLPFLGAFRRVSRPTTFGGIAWQEGTLILPAFLLTHRRSDRFPDPDRFRPERFLDRPPSSCDYAPFGGGVRHCLGDQLALSQMRVMLTELLRTFDIVPIGRWSDREKNRRTMLVVRDPLRARVRRWSGS